MTSEQEHINPNANIDEMLSLSEAEGFNAPREFMSTSADASEFITRAALRGRQCRIMAELTVRQMIIEHGDFLLDQYSWHYMALSVARHARGREDAKEAVGAIRQQRSRLNPLSWFGSNSHERQVPNA